MAEAKRGYWSFFDIYIVIKVDGCVCSIFQYQRRAHGFVQVVSHTLVDVMCQRLVKHIVITDSMLECRVDVFFSIDIHVPPVVDDVRALGSTVER